MFLTILSATWRAERPPLSDEIVGNPRGMINGSQFDRKLILFFLALNWSKMYLQTHVRTQRRYFVPILTNEIVSYSSYYFYYLLPISSLLSFFFALLSDNKISVPTMVHIYSYDQTEVLQQFVFFFSLIKLGNQSKEGSSL